MTKTTVRARDSSLADLIGPGDKVFLTRPAATPNVLTVGEDSNTRAGEIDRRLGRTAHCYRNRPD